MPKTTRKDSRTRRRKSSVGAVPTSAASKRATPAPARPRASTPYAARSRTGIATRPAPEIEHYMSSIVVVIDPSQTLAEAIRLMRLHEIRHLPVVAQGRVVGLISQRDVLFTSSLDAVDLAQVLVAEAMRRSPYVVDPEENVDVVAREMARRKIGSAVVAHNDKLLGLFTTTDALLALAAVVENARVPGERSPTIAPLPQPRAPAAKRKKSSKVRAR